jgi:hypothetical protein
MEQKEWAYKYYEVITEDSYILALHRIQAKENRENFIDGLPVVYIQHG